MQSENVSRLRERIKWRCRRGLLELDLVFEPFLREHLDRMGENDCNVLYRFLELSDGEIWDLVSCRKETTDPEFMVLLEKLR